MHQTRITPPDTYDLLFQEERLALAIEAQLDAYRVHNQLLGATRNTGAQFTWDATHSWMPRRYTPWGPDLP